MLLSVDWDYFAGTGELVFDSPFWGTRDLEFDRYKAWITRALKRSHSGFEVLCQDFPLFGDPLTLEKFADLPCYATLSHSDAYGLLEKLQVPGVINLDSHHDLYSLSGDPNRLRPGNWAGLALEHGLINTYTCIYPTWHENVRVTEGFDLERTRQELPTRFSTFNVKLERGRSNLEKSEVEAVLLVQSPAWTNPLYDSVFLELCQKLKAEFITPPLERPFPNNLKPVL